MSAVRKTSYVLDNPSEFDRLEIQAKQKGYCLEEELKQLKIRPEQRLLDAGCGSGVVTKFLAASRHPTISIDACDFSKLRIQQAKKQNTDLARVKYHTADLSNLPFSSESFDAAVSRYVYEYLPDPVQATKELARVLKPGGIIYLIDLDGVFLNFWTSNPHFNQLLMKLGQAIDFDLFIGRKLPSILKQAGLRDVEWKMTSHPFTGEELEAERENNRIRLVGAREKFITALGTPELYEEFTSLYLEEMDRADASGSVMYFNKFIAWGTK